MALCGRPTQGKIIPVPSGLNGRSGRLLSKNNNQTLALVRLFLFRSSGYVRDLFPTEASCRTEKGKSHWSVRMLSGYHRSMDRAVLFRGFLRSTQLTNPTRAVRLYHLDRPNSSRHKSSVGRLSSSLGNTLLSAGLNRTGSMFVVCWS